MHVCPAQEEDPEQEKKVKANATPYFKQIKDFSFSKRTAVLVNCIDWHLLFDNPYFSWFS